MIYRPSNPAVEILRNLFKRRVGDSTLAYLGNNTDDRVEVPESPGLVYVRFPAGKDGNGNLKFSSPTTAWSVGVAHPNYKGAAVYVKYGPNGLQIDSSHYPSLVKAGYDPRAYNPITQQSKFVYPYQLTYGLASAVATTTTDSLKVMVKWFRHYTGNRFQAFETPNEADKIDLSSHVPGAGEQCLVAIWIDTYTNDYEVTASTPRPLNEQFDETDIQELTIGRPPDAMPLKAFRLANDQITLKQSADESDLRQHMDTPPIWGWPQTLTSRERVRDNRTFIIPGDYVNGTGGSITLESGARLLRVHKSNVTNTAPTTGDDSADGYSIGSLWFDTATGLLYVASDVSVGTAVWDEVASGGGMDSFTVSGDSGTPFDIEDADTLGFTGTGGITTLADDVTKTVTIDGSAIIDSLEFTVSADSGSTVFMGDDDNLSINGGTGLTTSSSGGGGGGSVTINLNDTAVTPGSYTNLNATIDQQGRITAASNGSGGMTSFAVSADSGSDQTITNGNTLELAGGDGIDTVASATDTVTFAVDSTVIRTTGTQTRGTGLTITSPIINEILDSNNNEELKFTATATAVNEFTMANAATGNAPTLSATGGDTNIGIGINAKGTGTVSIEGAVVINDSGADRDVRIEGDTNANLFFTDASADVIGIGTNTPNANALIHLVSTTKASIPAPIMTTTQRDAISSPIEGMMVWLSDQDDVSVYTGSDWVNLRRPFYSEMLNPFSAHTNVSGTALIWASDTNQSGGGTYRKLGAAINDQTDYTIALPVGTYQIEYMAQRGASQGVMSIIIDGNLVSTHDLYTAATTYNSRGTSSSFNISTPGNHTLSIKAGSKNASSGNYFIPLSWLQIIRTGEYP